MNKALLVGINTYAKQPGLAGCINDVEDVKAYLEQQGVCADDIVVLLDAQATKLDIVAGLERLIGAATPGDHLFFHFSGHGVRMPSSDPQETDSADETLCPYDFDWSSETALTDNDILGLLDALQGGVRLTFVADSCHSGDFARSALVRASRARTLPPPAHIRERLARRTGVRSLRSLARDNCAFVSACSPWQTAADTSFDGRPNGAFTYQFLKLAKEAAGLSLDDVVEKLGPVLLPYEMTPVAEGSDRMRVEAFVPVRTHGLVRRAASRMVSVRGENSVFDQTWRAQLFGLPVTVSFRVLVSNGALTAHVTADIITQTGWSFSLNGDSALELDLAYGVKLGLAVSGWNYAADSVRFNLGIDLLPPFFSPVGMARIPVSIPVATFTREALAAAPSPADFVALLALKRARSDDMASVLSPARLVAPVGSSAAPPQRSRGAGDVYEQAGWLEPRNYTGGAFGTRFEEDIRWDLPDGAVRDHVIVNLNPPNFGNVYFSRWLSDDPTVGHFRLHVGIASFRGGQVELRMMIRDEPGRRNVAMERRSGPRPLTHEDVFSGDETDVIATDHLLPPGVSLSHSAANGIRA